MSLVNKSFIIHYALIFSTAMGAGTTGSATVVIAGSAIVTLDPELTGSMTIGVDWIPCG